MRVRIVRESFGKDFELMVDFNCGFGFSAAEDFMRQIEPFELKWIEEPVWPPDDFDALRKLNKMGPVAAGENFFSVHEFNRLLQTEALTFYQPDVAKCGGISALIEIVEAITSHGARVALHNDLTTVGWVLLRGRMSHHR